jgi:hypothetical protein
VLALGIVALVLLTRSPTDQVAPTGVEHVTVTDDSVVVSGGAPPGETVQVYASEPYENPAAWSDREPVGDAQAAGDGTFSVTVAHSPGDTDPYGDAYLAVVEDEALGSHHFADDLAITPTNTYAYPTSPTKKGLQSQVTSDAGDLGIGHATVNVPLNRVMQAQDEGPEQSVPFEREGETYWFSTDSLARLDRQIRPMSANGTLVNLILLLQEDQRAGSAWPLLRHPDAVPGAGKVYAFDTVTARGTAAYTAAVAFLAERYTREDARHGRATGFIVGNEVDAQWTWQNMGEKTLQEFLDSYERALRLTYLAARTAYSEPRVYVSLTHSWRLPSGHTDQPLRYYPGKHVLDELNRLTKAHGDYPWHIAHHTYPEKLKDPAFWLDTTATDDVATTPRITPRNIELLDAYVQQPELAYRGSPRRIILSEQGCHAADDSDQAQRLQAACFAYAYYKVAFLDGIDAFILHRHVDHPTEEGLRVGLWNHDPSRPEPAAPYRPRLIRSVFQSIDTTRSVESTAFALDVIGIDDWGDVVEGWDPDAVAVRTEPTPLSVSLSARATSAAPGATRLADFSDGVDGWRASDAVGQVRAEGAMLRADVPRDGLFGSNLAQLWRGVEAPLPEPVTTGPATALSLDVRAPADARVGARHVRVRVYGSEGAVAQGTAAIGSDGNWHTFRLDLSTWNAEEPIVRLKVLVRGSTNQIWDGPFWIDNVRLTN